MLKILKEKGEELTKEKADRCAKACSSNPEGCIGYCGEVGNDRDMLMGIEEIRNW